MKGNSNIGLYLKNNSDRRYIIEQIIKNQFLDDYIELNALSGELFSSITINRMIEEELRHDRFVIHSDKNQGLHSMSSGEQKKALLKYLLNKKPQYLILDDIYSNIDVDTQKEVREKLSMPQNSVILIQLFSRMSDLLPGINTVLTINSENQIQSKQTKHEFANSNQIYETGFHINKIPEAYRETDIMQEKMVELYSVSASYGKNQVLNNISWVIRKNEFWQLAGPNGSGKSTLVSLITGDNPFGYGQNVILFGRKKGSGESIWDIKQKIGYFTPAMMHRFNHNDSIENMIMSGFKDSVGLYSKASNMQQRIANRWLELLGMKHGKVKFRNLSIGQQRMVMVARAMVKHPPLLILDEPTIELDDENSIRFVEMINNIKNENHTAIIYVSHRDEEGLSPGNIFELIPTNSGYTGRRRK